MSMMIKLSLLLNLAVLIPICVSFAMDANWVREAYGDVSPARDILFSLYLTILLGSAALLFLNEPKYVVALLAAQILYKLTTPLTVGTPFHPVVMSNIAIACFHAVTLWLVLKSPEVSSST